MFEGKSTEVSELFQKPNGDYVLGSLSNKEFKNIRASNLLSSWEGCMSGTH